MQVQPAPQPPQRLIEEYANGNLVLFVGAGVSAACGLPGWKTLLERMLDDALQQKAPVDAASVKDLIDSGDLLLAAAELRGRMGDDFRPFLVKQLNAQPGDIHRLLPQMRFASILTTNYDRLIEIAFGSDCPPVHTQADSPELAGQARERTPAVVKVHGDVNRIDTVVLGQADYRKAMYGNEAFKQYLASVFSTHTVLFTGCGLTDPDLLAFLEELKFQKGGALGGNHFALMKTKGMNPLKRRSFEEGYGIRVFGDDTRDGFPDIAALLRSLAQVRATPVRVETIADISKEEADDVAGLLEAMGQRILDRKDAAGCVHFLSEQKAGAEIRRVLTCYLPHEARPIDLERLRQAVRADRIEDGILLTPAAVPEGVADAARLCGVQAYGREEFVGKLANFDSYLDKLRQEYETADIDRLFVPLNIRQEVRGAAAGEPIPLDDFIAAWLKGEGRNHLSVLGDFGTGKTWMSRRLAYRLARAGGRIPVVILLRDYSRAYDIEQVLTDAFSNRFDIKLGAGFKTIRRLNDEGRLLLIFDGFDEMERRASDYRTALDNFWEIAKLLSPRAKIVLTCRTAFFRHRTEEEDVLRADRGGVTVVKGDDLIDLRDKREFEVVHLTEFDDEQIREALRRLAPLDWEPLWDKIRGLPHIEDLAQRPVLLGMIAETFPKMSRETSLNLATLYQTYTDGLLERRGAAAIPAEDRRFFVRELAWDMQTTNRLTVPFSEFPERVSAHFGLKDDPAKAAFFERDVRTQSYLIRDDAGNYRFAHKSIMEYFVARKLAALLEKGEAADIPLTDAIASFVHYLLAPTYRYQRVERDGMVWIPPGPFIYGAESESKLRIATLDQGFWMDRYPVTNKEFCAFLNAEAIAPRAAWNGSIMYEARL